MESGVHSSLHPNCHHQIAYAKFNLKIHYLLHKNGKYDIIEKLMLITLEFPWERKFENNSVNDKVNILNATIKNILPNYIPHETIMCDDRDPPWINKNIKQLILKKIKHTNPIFEVINPSNSLANFSFFKQS